MAARGHPHPTLQEAVEQYRDDRKYYIRDNQGTWRFVGPFQETQRYKEVTERIKQEDIHEKSRQDYLLKGYQRNAFDSKAQFEKWADEHIPYVQYEQAKQNIMQHGQTAIARVVTQEDEGFQVIELQPVPGRFWTFETQAMRDEWAKKKWKFHISLTHKDRSPLDPSVFERVRLRYDGQLLTIRIAEIQDSGNLMLDTTHGIGADPDVQFTTTRPGNSDRVALLHGWEFAIQHTVWESGFGAQLNYTIVRSNTSFDNTKRYTETQFAVTGVSDSANAVFFYDKDGLQGRVAYNWRGGFLGGYGFDPFYTEAYGQWDASASWEFRKGMTVFVEGINITQEDRRGHMRNDNTVFFAAPGYSRYAAGFRYSF
jgi:hypothetical protein